MVKSRLLYAMAISRIYDVVIIGGGLAGLTCALHLSRKGVDVLLIEKNTYPHHKVCGEYVSNEVLPYLKRLLSLSRITLINHQKALNPLPVLPSETQIFISVPEFHPKSLTSEYRTYIHGHACMFSTYSWLLSAKKNLPSYFLNVEQNLVLVKHPSDMYKDLSLSYQSPNGSIYSWSRLKNHKVERLEKVFISQVNQLEALLRHLRPRLESTDLQPTFAAIKHQKTVVLQRNRS